jgi:hypothetical protein
MRFGSFLPVPRFYSLSMLESYPWPLDAIWYPYDP